MRAPSSASGAPEKSSPCARAPPVLPHCERQAALARPPGRDKRVSVALQRSTALAILEMNRRAKTYPSLKV